MSDIYGVKPYGKTVLETLGYVEHKDPFNKDNIPANLKNKAFHMSQGIARTVSNHQDHLSLQVPLTISAYKQGFNNPNQKFLDALTDAERIRDAMLAPQTRLTQPHIKNVTLETMDVAPVAASNNNTMVLSFVFNMLILVSTRRAS